MSIQESERQRVREHSLKARNSNFYLGFEKGFSSETGYKASFKPANFEDVGSPKSEMLKLKSNLRNNNFQLGNDDTSKLFISAAAQSFCTPMSPQLAKLPAEIKNDLTTHHFNFGDDKSKHETNYQSSFQSQQINSDIFKDKKEQANVSRKHNHQFGDIKDYFSSVYDQKYSKAYDPAFLRQGKSKSEIQLEIQSIRKSNLALGNILSPKYGTEQKEYKGTPQISKSVQDPSLKKSHLQFGIQNNDYETTASSVFQGSQVPQNNQEMVKNLSKDGRAEHYSMGNNEREFQSENQKYSEIDRNSIQKQPDLSYLKKSSLYFEGFGNSNPILNYVSNYKKEFDNYSSLPKTTKARNERQDIGSNVFFGNNNQPIQSETAKRYVDFGSQKIAALDKATKDNLKKHHYELGTDINNFQSQNKSIFSDRSKEFVLNKLDSNTLKDLRRNHFEYGHQKSNFATSNKDIGLNQGKPNKLDPITALDIRTHHYQPDDPIKFQGSYFQEIYKGIQLN